jgi:hypothetical protein
VLTWASKNDPRVARAKATLATVPVASSKHGASLPWEFVDREAYKENHDDAEINAAIKKAPIVEVRLDELHSIQHSVKAPKVAYYLDHQDMPKAGTLHPKAGTPIDLPVIIEQDGIKYIHDGHHRLMAQWLLGESRAEVRLVDFDAKGKK